MNELSKPIGRESIGGPETPGDVYLLLCVGLLIISVSIFLVVSLPNR